MPVRIAEYLGQRTDQDERNIQPVRHWEKPRVECPFMDRHCDKLVKGNPPVCAVRKSDGRLWIVCEHRLCATARKRRVPSPDDPAEMIDVPIGLTEHQVEVLWAIANTIYRGDFSKENIAVAREIPIPLEDGRTKYKADYIMRNLATGAEVDKIVLEMQGGGETSNTGSITRHIQEWCNKTEPSNSFLRELVTASPIETNAWRRQQEQFLVKGNSAKHTGGRLVFAVGELLYEYLSSRFRDANLRDLRNHNWDLCLITFVCDEPTSIEPGPVKFKIDENRCLFTDYSQFVRFLTSQGMPNPEMFQGDFINLEGGETSI